MRMRVQQGFTLIELMIVVAILGVILVVAIPAYRAQIRHSRRADAEQVLMDCVLHQERYRADNPTYGTAAQAGCQTTSSAFYTFAVSGNTATAFSATATAVVGSDQAKDKQEGISCTPLSINQARTKGPDPKCWK